MPSRLARHPHPDDRNVAPLRPRRELYEALFAYAVHVSARRRKRAGLRPAPINAVADRGQIWFEKKTQRAVLELYQEHVFYLTYGRRRKPRELHKRAEREHISARTLTRHVAGYRRDKLLTARNYSRFDHKRGEWLQLPNVYTITRTGVLWIKTHARALQIPRFL